MTDQTHQDYLSNLVFYSITSICTWAGTKNGILFLEGDETMPYILRDGIYYYFGQYGEKPEHEYRLVGMTNRDLGE